MVAQVELKVNKLNSIHTQLPYDFYNLKFCKPKGGVVRVRTTNASFVDCLRSAPKHACTRTVVAFGFGVITTAPFHQ